MNRPEVFHWILRSAHIGVGSLALILFWIPILSKKGSPLHTWSGKLFVIACSFVAATAAVSCVWALTAPLSFSGITRELTVEEMDTLTHGIRFLFAILGTLMTWMVAGMITGIHAVRHKSNLHLNARLARAFWWVAMLTSATLLIYGLTSLSDGGHSWIHIAIGLFGILDARKYLSALTEPLSTPKGWWYIHMECMIGVGIAIYTAFFVFGFSRILPNWSNSWQAVLFWLLPVVVGVPVTSLWIARYKRKFGEAA
jgi:hypothetical protein